MPRGRKAESVAVTPPRHVIDLSLPPQERYKSLARDHAAQLQSLTGLYDQLLRDASIPPRLIPYVRQLSKWCLRRVHDEEQTLELRGIAEVSGMPMYLLVAFNVILDLLMGCTSGGVRSVERGQSPRRAKMLHFRTLDWSMDPLRKVVVQLDFVRSQSQPDEVVASSITYIGFVGVLTGVRKGLSMSLNFRAVHDATSKMEHFKFYLHHLKVLLGRRPSIASLLRHHLLHSVREREEAPSPKFLLSAMSDITRQRTTAAYLILSDGESTVTVEKDYSTCTVSRSEIFIVRTNHDVENHKVDHQSPTPAVLADVNTGTSRTEGHDQGQSKGLAAAVHNEALASLLEESEERLECMKEKWQASVEHTLQLMHTARRRERGGRKRTRSMSRSTSRRRHRHSDGLSARSTEAESEDETEAEATTYVTQEEAVMWLSDFPTTNECTHYAAVLDPTEGNVAWCVAYPKPLPVPDRRSSRWEQQEVEGLLLRTPRGIRDTILSREVRW